MKVTGLLPKRIRRLANRIQGAAQRAETEDRRTYSGYDQAAAACNGADYDDGLIGSVVFDKTVAYRDRLAQSGGASIGDRWVQAILPVSLAYHDLDKPLTVLDFGGACGAHYFTVKSMLSGELRLRWHVVETPQMVQRAKALETDELKFFATIQAAQKALGNVDVVHTSGALQYVRDPYGALRDLVACEARYLALSRQGVTSGNQDVVTIQESRLADHGPGSPPAPIPNRTIRLPLTFPVKRKIDAIVAENYRKLVELPENSGVIRVNDEPIVGLAFVAERNQ